MHKPSRTIPFHTFCHSNTSHPTNQLQLLIVSFHDPWPLTLTLTLSNLQRFHHTHNSTAPDIPWARYNTSALLTHTHRCVRLRRARAGRSAIPACLALANMLIQEEKWKVNEAYCALEYLYCPLFPWRMSSFTRLHRVLRETQINMFRRSSREKPAAVVVRNVQKKTKKKNIKSFTGK